MIARPLLPCQQQPKPGWPAPVNWLQLFPSSGGWQSSPVDSDEFSWCGYIIMLLRRIVCELLQVWWASEPVSEFWNFAPNIFMNFIMWKFLASLRFENSQNKFEAKFQNSTFIDPLWALSYAVGFILISSKLKENKSKICKYIHVTNCAITFVLFGENGRYYYYY